MESLCVGRANFHVEDRPLRVGEADHPLVLLALPHVDDNHRADVALLEVDPEIVLGRLRGSGLGAGTSKVAEFEQSGFVPAHNLESGVAVESAVVQALRKNDQVCRESITANV